jgi:hypothetical protein
MSMMPSPDDASLQDKSRVTDAPADESDYGSDFGEDGEAVVVALLQQLEAEDCRKPFVLESIEEHGPPPSTFARVSKSSSSQQSQREETCADDVEARQRAGRAVSEEVEYDIISRTSFIGI